MPKQRASNAKLETLIRVSPLAIIMFDIHENIQLWNPAAEQLFGWTAQEVIGKLSPVVPMSKQNEYSSLISQINSGKALVSFETVCQRKDGSLVDVSISSAAVHNNEGLMTGRMAIIADVS
jgi:PAS domain S-box-containing protein